MIDHASATWIPAKGKGRENYFRSQARELGRKLVERIEEEQAELLESVLCDNEMVRKFDRVGIRVYQRGILICMQLTFYRLAGKRWRAIDRYEYQVRGDVCRYRCLGL